MDANFKQNLSKARRGAGKGRKALALILCLALLCGALGSCGTGGAQRFTDTYYDAFDTAISVLAYCKDQAEFKALSERIHKEFREYHKLFDIYNEYPDLVNAAALNRLAKEGQTVKVPAELFELLELSKDACTQTGGKVNIAMGAVLLLWHNAREYAADHPDSAYVPQASELAKAAEHCDINKLILDKDALTVSFADPQMSLDLGAAAKGWATEKIARGLEADGYSNIAISAGGNVRVIGARADGSKWSIAVQDPSEGASASDYVDVLLLENISLVTSGVNQRGFKAGGKWYHHIIDPDTLQPESRYLSVTVLTEDSGLADALSTALFNMSVEEGKALLSALKKGEKTIGTAAPKTAEALWVLPDKSTVSTDGYAAFRK